MEKQSFELITGMQRHCNVHRIVYDGAGSRVLFFLQLRKRILQVCQQHPKIQVIHFNDALLATFCIWHKGYEHLKRTVTLHGLDVVFPSGIYRKHVLPKFNQFDHLIAVSRATADRAIALGIAADKVSVISNGVDQRSDDSHNLSWPKPEFLKQYAIPPGKLILLAIGRPVKRKGFSWFIREVVPKLNGSFIVLFIGPFDKQPKILERVLSVVPENLRQKIMLFLGFGSDAGAIRELLDIPGADGQVRHLGRLPEEQKQAILKFSDAFIMPNVSVNGDMEGFGLVCLEAALAGATVFAANIDGIPDAIQHEKNGFLLPIEDSNIWASKLNKLIANPEGFEAHKMNFQQFTMDNYSWEKMVKAYYELFLSLRG
ncbi:glycosyltransferase family 4 protein [Dyadobacter arcticus]|uniref:Phosphatidylinositol alpha-1,6-mannosyltransferase n=1 Tax=Dyadobacter arcticus TaxID=1078754 RepID=A0ABX0UNR4_9BACT|nr:glycosyltransferase family 4 protein [Dyadobacter arcticus]NIJ54507.1 phosphatidylinositol alpha-1,6-mannosyltransferase [Dyadobacter arcticus]